VCGKHKLKAHENNVRRKMLDIRNLNIRTEKPIWARHFVINSLLKGKAIPVRGREGPYGCETLRLPHFL
jgi:hypothetical protein